MKFAWRGLVCATLSIQFALLALAQGPGANITGEVHDPSGAIVAVSRVTARNTATNVTRETVTDSAGIFVISSLQPGPYDVSVEASGFNKDLRSGIVLQVAEVARVDFVLKLGSSSETVNVVAAALVTETETASTGQVIENKKVTELPLNGRQFYGLALLAPGAYQPAENSTVGYRGGFMLAGAGEQTTTLASTASITTTRESTDLRSFLPLIPFRNSSSSPVFSPPNTGIVREARSSW